MNKVVKIALIGNPLTKSMSDTVFNRLSDYSSNKIEFKKIETKNLLKTVKWLKKNNYNGFFVTVPYKNKILKYVIFKNKIAKEINAANCIKIKQNSLKATNTDYLSFKKLTEKTDFNSKKITVIGNGATASMIVNFLKDKKPEQLIIIARNHKKSKKLTEILKEYKVPYKLENFKSPVDSDILINASPLGMYFNKKLKINFKKIKLIIDFAYKKPYTDLIKKARKHSIKNIDGFEILVLQAILGYQFITGENLIKYYRKMVKYIRGLK